MPRIGDNIFGEFCVLCVNEPCVKTHWMNKFPFKQSKGIFLLRVIFINLCFFTDGKF